MTLTTLTMRHGVIPVSVTLKGCIGAIKSDLKALCLYLCVTSTEVRNALTRATTRMTTLGIRH